MLRSLMMPVALALALPAAPAKAVVVLFSDFESVTSPDFRRQGYATLRAAEGWTGGAAGLEVQSNRVAGRAFSGRNLVELDSTRNSSMWVDLPKGRYIVSYWYSPRPGVAAASNGISLSLDSALLDRVSADGEGDTVWQQRQVAFRSDGGRLVFAAEGRSDSLGGYLDDIMITGGAVPELATWAMLIIGFAFVGIAARRRRSGVTA
jgi:hypothetical protein